MNNISVTPKGGTIASLTNGSSTDDIAPTLTGTAEAGSTVSIYDGSTLLGTVIVGAAGPHAAARSQYRAAG